MKSYGVLRFVDDPQITNVGETVKSFFTLTYNEKRYNSNNELIKIPHYLEFEVWDTAADFIVKNCRKGDEIYVEATPKNCSGIIVFRINSFRIFT